MSDPDWSPSLSNRRTVLRGLAATSVVGIAGCSSVLGSTTTLSAETEQNGNHTTIVFSDGEEIRYSVRLSSQFVGDELPSYYPFNVATGDQGDLTLSSFRLEFYQLPPESLYLGEMTKGLADIVEFYRSDDSRRTVLTLPDPDGVYASGTLQFPLVFRPAGDAPHRLSGRIDATLVDGGIRNHEYIARSQFDTTIE